MAAQIRPNRLEVNDRFPMLGFTIRTDGTPQRAEVAIATDLVLFRPENKGQRTAANFYSSRAGGALSIPRGEAIYVVPPEVLAQFIGAERLYVALATTPERNGTNPHVDVLPGEGSPYISLKGLTGRSLKRVRLLPSRQQRASGYGVGGTGSLEWAGDNAVPGLQPAAKIAPVSPTVPSAPMPVTGGDQDYNDGFGPLPSPEKSRASNPADNLQSVGVAQSPRAQSRAFSNQSAAAEDAAHGVKGPVPKVWACAQEVVAPFYDPADPASALTCQNDVFSQAREEWFVGVPNTRIFPHSAICQLNMVDAAGNGYGGTGFYIGPNRILTCAHNLHGMISVTIIPGKNSSDEPFGRCTLNASSWRVSNRYPTDGSDYDLAVIDSVQIAAPGGRWFEFLNQTPSGRLPIVVCGYSAQSDAVPELTQAIDGDMQHLHGGYVTQQSNLEVMEYPILTLHGASGAPVYHIIDSGTELRALVCGVHVSGEPAAQGLNRACFITPAKIDWIEGRTTAFSLGVSNQSANAEDATHGIEEPIPDTPDAAGQSLAYSRPLDQQPEYPQASRFVPAASVNYRRVTTPRAINRIVIHITDGGPNINGTIAWFQNPNQRNRRNQPIHVSAHYVVGQNGEVVQMVRHNDVAWHAGSANGDSIGIEHVANTHGLNPTEAEYCASAALVRWLCDTYGIPIDRDHILGHSEADPRTSHTACPNAVWDWAYFMDMVLNAYCRGREGCTQTLASQALSGEYFSLNWDDVQLIPQRYDLSCWAAAASMVVGWIKEQSLDEATIADLASHAPTTGMSVSAADVKAFAMALGLSMEMPQNYTVDGFRQLLENNGPLFVGKQMGGGFPNAGHAVVVVGMYFDGTRAYVRIADPWDRVVGSPGTPGQYLNSHTTGSRYIMAYGDFVAEYEWIQAANNSRPPTTRVYPLQILHSDSNQGRLPNYGQPPAGYAQSLATQPTATRTRSSSRTTRLPPPPRASAFEVPVIPSAPPMRRRVTDRIADVSWELDQYDGMKAPAGMAVTGSVAPIAGPTINLSDWPYIDDLTGRTYAIVVIDWRHQGGMVGDVQITVPVAKANDGYALKVTATITDGPDTAAIAALRIVIRHEYSHVGEPNQVAVTEVTLYGDGRHERQNRWDQLAQANAA